MPPFCQPSDPSPQPQYLQEIHNTLGFENSALSFLCSRLRSGPSRPSCGLSEPQACVLKLQKSELFQESQKSAKSQPFGLLLRVLGHCFCTVHGLHIYILLGSGWLQHALAMRSSNSNQRPGTSFTEPGSFHKACSPPPCTPRATKRAATQKLGYWVAPGKKCILFGLNGVIEGAHKPKK